MTRFIMLLFAMSVYVMAYAEQYSYDFDSTPLPKAFIKIMEDHPETDINFIYNELETYTTSASVRSDNAGEAILQVIALNPVILVNNDNTYYVEALQHGKYLYRGKAVGTDHEPVVGASVLLLAPTDSAMLTYGITDADGNFTIPCDRRKVLAEISCIGYQTSYHTFSTFDVGSITIREQTVKLDEVNVSSSSIMESKGMTIVYPTASDVRSSSTSISLLQKLLWQAYRPTP